jgi:hypothetical protein
MRTLMVAGKITKRGGKIVESRVRCRKIESYGMPWGRSGMTQTFQERREIFPPAR